jgi:NADH dehydrogenase [ubiquinone] 1 alpha subcomplex assembly factor 6
MASPPDLAELLRRQDRDRFLSALFVPVERRGAVLALYAFHNEIAKTREVVSEPLLGRIRLQWWREAIDDAYSGATVRPHEVVTPLATAIRERALSRTHFDTMIEARELELTDEPPATVSALEDYCAATAGRLQRLVLEALGVRDDSSASAADEIGIAYGLAGLIRAIPYQARRRWHPIPASVAREVGLEVETLFEAKSSPALSLAVERLARAGRAHLARARALRPPKAALPALLPARIAAGYLRDIEAVRGNVFDPRLMARSSRTVWRLAWGAATRRY